jgi:hypothetical protein
MFTLGRLHFMPYKRKVDAHYDACLQDYVNYRPKDAN